jgi:hypothetical protein
MSNDNRKFVSGSVSFGNREDKDNYELIGLLRDYQYLLKNTINQNLVIENFSLL